MAHAIHLAGERLAARDEERQAAWPRGRFRPRRPGAIVPAWDPLSAPGGARHRSAPWRCCSPRWPPPGCAVWRVRPPAPPRPAPGYDRLRDTLAAVDARGLAGRRIALDPGHGGLFRGALGVGGLSRGRGQPRRGAGPARPARGPRRGRGPHDARERPRLPHAGRLLAERRPGRARASAPPPSTPTCWSRSTTTPTRAAPTTSTRRRPTTSSGTRAPRSTPPRTCTARWCATSASGRTGSCPATTTCCARARRPALLTETSYITNPDVEERLRLPGEAATRGRRAVHRPGALLRAQGRR